MALALAEWGVSLDMAIGAAGVVVTFAILFSVRGLLRPAQVPVESHLTALSEGLGTLERGQHQLAGGLSLLAENQVAAQARTMEQVERRLEDVQRAMGETLHGTATRTARSLGELHQRIETIDRAQDNIEKLSLDVLGLQDILSNKQTRGVFGEIQLNEIVAAALPPDAFAVQAALSTGRRVDCLIHQPAPALPIPVDAKFPLEGWEALRRSTDEAARKAATRAFRTAVQAHQNAIAERYLIPGETAECALMFVPSEAVFADIHAILPETVRRGFERQIWMVSPTTLMAVLNTMRGVLRDARLRTHGAEIRRELDMLAGDLGRLDERVAELDRHFAMAEKDLAGIRTSARKAASRLDRFERLEFGADAAEADAEAAAPSAARNTG